MTTNEDLSWMLDDHQYLNAAVVAALDLPSCDVAAPRPVEIDLNYEDYDGAPRWFVTVDVEYHSDGARALFGFDHGGTDTIALWQD